MYEYNRTSGEVLDYHMFTADLMACNDKGVLTWVCLRLLYLLLAVLHCTHSALCVVQDHTYSFRSEYGLPDLHPTTLQHLVTRFSQSPELLQTWFDHYHTGVPTQSCVQEKCVKAQLCMVCARTHHQTASFVDNSCALALWVAVKFDAESGRSVRRKEVPRDVPRLEQEHSMLS